MKVKSSGSLKKARRCLLDGVTQARTISKVGVWCVYGSLARLCVKLLQKWDTVGGMGKKNKIKISYERAF